MLSEEEEEEGQHKLSLLQTKPSSKKMSLSTIPSVTPREKNKLFTTKKRPAASGGTSSSATKTARGNKHAVVQNKKSKCTKGQMTLGSFFGLPVVKKKDSSASSPSARSSPPPPPAISDERRAQLRDICIGRKIVATPTPSSTTTTTTTTTTTPVPAKVSPIDCTDRKVAVSRNQMHGTNDNIDDDDDHHHGKDDSDAHNHDEDDGDEYSGTLSSKVMTPLAKDTIKHDSKVTYDHHSTESTNDDDDDDDEAIRDDDDHQKDRKNSMVDNPLSSVQETSAVDKRVTISQNNNITNEEMHSAVRSTFDSKDEKDTMEDTETPDDQVPASNDDLSVNDGEKSHMSTPTSEESANPDDFKDLKGEKRTTMALKVSSTKKVDEEMKDMEAQPCADDTIEEKSTAADEQTQTIENVEDEDEKEMDTGAVADQSKSEDSIQQDKEEKCDAQLTKLRSLYDTYHPQAMALFSACREGLVESVPALDRKFPDQVPTGVDESKARLAALIEGRSESLSALAVDVSLQLKEFYNSANEVTDEIKVLAKRQPLIKDHVRTVLEDGSKLKGDEVLDIFEDESPDRFWQWNVTVVDLMPNKTVVKQRRAKIRKEVTYLHNLVSVLQTLKQLLSSNVNDRKNLMAKLSRQEEKVLQYQREQAKAVLEQQLKESQRLEKEKAKAAKKEAEAAKKKEAAAAKKEAEASKKKAEAAKKEAAALAKKEAKAKEAEEKAKQSEQELQKKRAQLHRQQGAMISFLQKASTTPTKKPEPIVEKQASPVPTFATRAPIGNFDVEHFRSQINSYQHDAVVSFCHPSESAVRSRRRRSRSVQLSVYVTVQPDNPFEARPYADLQKVTVCNRFKFLSFHEDVRPPYHGTWSKKSHGVNPRNPFKKDRKFFDYDYDSEAEWEEGDNEAGEDIENAADDEEEKDEEEAEGEDDGWLAADDDLDDDPDEETKLLRQKVVRQEDKLERIESFIAPVNGRPLTASDKVESYLAGVASDEAFELLSSHEDIIVTDVPLFLDPFPPIVDEDPEPSSPTEKRETSIADMQAILRFIHHNSVASKEKLVDELRLKLPDATSSRAQAMRTLESVAEKQRHPIKGQIWEIKREILEQYELNDLLSETTEDDPESAKKLLLRTLAGRIHNSTHTSKEKLVDDLQATHASILVSRAETLRHVEALAEKKKRKGGGVYWEVKTSAQQDLDLELRSPDTPPDGKATNGSDPTNDEEDHPSSSKKRKLNFDDNDANDNTE